MYGPGNPQDTPNGPLRFKEGRKLFPNPFQPYHAAAIRTQPGLRVAGPARSGGSGLLFSIIAICFSGKSSAARLVPITGKTPGASAYLFSNQNTTATMISASMIRSTHNGNFTPHPFLGAGTPIMFSVTGRAAG